MATEAEIKEIIKFYVGYYNRAPDALGLNFWEGAFDGGFSLAAMAVDFSTQAETKSNYPFFDPAKKPNPTLKDLGDFIDTVYENLFNRTPDTPGKDFWAGKINSAEFTVGQAISLIIAGATTSPDMDVITNKVAVGLDFFTKLNAEPGGSAYVFTPADVTAATDIQKSVTADPASVNTAATATDSYISAFDGSTGPVTGITVNLTPGTDQPGGGNNIADTQGTSDDDTYSATVEANGGGTLQNSDNIAAGDGTDTLNVRVISTSGTQIVSPAASGLEKFVVTNQTTNGIFILDFVGIEGEMEVTAKDNAASALTGFANLEMGTKIRAENVDGIVGVNFKGDRSTSTDDSFDMFVQDSGTESASMVFVITDAQISSSDEDFENANIETGGTSASFLNMVGLELETLNVTGSQQLNVEDTTDNFADLKAVDASALTGGGININASANTQSDFAFTGSGFDDSLQLNRSLFNDANTLSLDGGDGIDTLIIESFNNLSAASINQADGFEVLQASSSTTSLDASDYTKIDTFSFAGQTGNDSRLNITGVTNDDLFIFESNVGRGDETVRFAADTAGQSLKFELKADSSSEVRIVYDTNSGNNNAAVGFGNSNISSVEIVSSGSNTDANVIRGVDNNRGNAFAFDNQNGPNNFTVSGSQALTITAEAGVDLTASDDERGFVSGVNLDGSDATGALRIAGSSSADALQGGSGNDILYGLGGNDVLTGNGGSDQFRFSDWSGTDKIQDFTAGEDKIGLQRVDFDNTNETSEGTVLNTSDYVQNLQAVANLTNADSDKLVELQLAATNDQITQTSVAATNTYLLVFNETSGKSELWFDADWSTASNRTMTAELTGIDTLAELIGLTNTDFVEYTF